MDAILHSDIIDGTRKSLSISCSQTFSKKPTIRMPGSVIIGKIKIEMEYDFII